MPLDPAKIKARRESLGMSASDAAARAGMDRPNWYRYESGKRIDPALTTAEQIAAALKCSLPSILAS